jgi:hypothetical protein
MGDVTEGVKHPLAAEHERSGGNLGFTTDGHPFIMIDARIYKARAHASSIQFTVVLDARPYDPKGNLKRTILRAAISMHAPRESNSPLDAGPVSMPTSADASRPGYGFGAGAGGRSSAVNWDRLRDKAGALSKAIHGLMAAVDRRDPNVLLALQQCLQRAAAQSEKSAAAHDGYAQQYAAGTMQWASQRGPDPQAAEQEIKNAVEARHRAEIMLALAHEIGTRYLANSETGRRAAEAAAREVARVIAARNEAATDHDKIRAEAKVRAEERAAARAADQRRRELLHGASEDMFAALKAILATSSAQRELAILDRGIGTETEVGKAWLSARAVVIKVEGETGEAADGR